MIAKLAVFLAAACCFLLLGPASQASAGPLPEGARAQVERAAAAVNPALVRIHVVTVDYAEGREQKSEATGSGVILTREGHVVTNHHVAGNAKQITCTLAGKEEIDGELVGSDPLTDICVIRLRPDRPRDFATARFGDSSRLQVGDPVLAMGSPLALTQSVTMGIVSNTELVIPGLFWPFRFEVDGEDVGSFVRWIGHDASISPGNSGGPLVNLEGEVVGINEMHFGLSAAIPGNLVRQVAEQLIKYGTAPRAWIGLDVQPVLRPYRQGDGVLVGGTIPGSPAEKAGFQSGDILVSLAGAKASVRVPEELPLFNQLVAGLPVGQEVEAQVLRNGKPIALRLKAEPRERAQPKERELPEWGATARDLSFLAAKELRTSTRDGVLVTSVRPGGPCDAAKPRLQEKDLILEVGGTPVRRLAELADLTARTTAGKAEPTSVLVAFERRAERYLTVVQVGKSRPPEPSREVQKAWLPVTTQVLTSEIAAALGLGERTGVRVTRVYPQQSAEKAGLEMGDIIVALNGKVIPASRPEHSEVFLAMLRQLPTGAEVELTVLRGGQERKLKVPLAASPRLPREMLRHRNDSFDFTARDVAFEDRMRAGWPENQRGAVVDAVSEGGWAALGHLAVGDLILDIDGHEIADAAALAERMRGIAAEKPQTVAFRVRRGIHQLYVELKPKWPAAGEPK